MCIVWSLWYNFTFTNKTIEIGPCGGQVDIVLAYYSNDPSSNPAEAYSFFFLFVKNENKQNRPGMAHF